MDSNARPAGATSERSPFNIAVIYEDTQSRNDAIILCERMAHNLGSECDFKVDWWKFDFLRDQTLGKAAADATAHADMVIVSTKSEAPLPDDIQLWMKACLQRKHRRQRALIALLRVAKELKKGVTPVHSFLAALAAASRMDFLPQMLPSPQTS